MGYGRARPEPHLPYPERPTGPSKVRTESSRTSLHPKGESWRGIDPRTKTDIAWNKIRRRITRWNPDVQIADWREIALDKLLTAAWEKVRKRLEAGETLELETEYETFVSRALEESVTTLPATDEVG